MKLLKTVFFAVCIIVVAIFIMNCFSLYQIREINNQTENDRISYTDILRKIVNINDGIRDVSNNVSIYGNELISMAEAVQPQDTDDCIAMESEVFLVREYCGIIGIYNEEGELVRTENISVSSLPQSDREKLTVGIVARSVNDLNDILLSLH